MAFIARVMTMSTKPVAAALRWNSACGRDTQLNIWMGMTENGDHSHSNEMKGKFRLDRRVGQECDKSKSANSDERRGLANCPGQTDDDAGQDPAHGVGQHMIAGGLPFRCTKSVSSFSHASRNGTDGFAGGDDDDGQDQQRQGKPG